MKTIKAFIACIMLITAFNVNAQENDTYYFAEINSIYDGDTFTVTIDLGFEVFKIETIRIARIDAPEIRGREKKEGQESKLALQRLLSSGKCYIIYKGRGKYGRAICEVYTSDARTNVSDFMVDNNFAEEYNK